MLAVSVTLQKSIYRCEFLEIITLVACAYKSGYSENLFTTITNT
jgi:hypothetical protein